MTTAIGRQVSTYRDSVTDASRLALQCWDMHKAVQDLILMAPGIVSSIEAVLRQSDIEQTVREELSKEMLGAMGQLFRRAALLREHNFELAGLDEFRSAVTAMRFLVADIEDAKAGERGPIPDSTDAGEETPPPQSWFEEDFTKLRGPKV